jgi:hypothetical protein
MQFSNVLHVWIHALSGLPNIDGSVVCCQQTLCCVSQVPINAMTALTGLMNILGWMLSTLRMLSVLQVRIDAVTGLRNMMEAYDESNLEMIKPILPKLLNDLFALLTEVRVR